METWQVVLAGVAGGAFPDILRLIGLRYEPDKTSYLRTWTFWFGFVLLLFAGGLAAYLTNQTTPLTLITALTVGFTAPEVLSRLFGADDGDGKNGDGKDVGGDKEVGDGSEGPVIAGPGGGTPTEARGREVGALRRWWGR